MPRGAFARYMARKLAEGYDLAHLKPRHLNTSQEVLSVLLADTEEIIDVIRVKTDTGAQTKGKSEARKATKV